MQEAIAREPVRLAFTSVPRDAQISRHMEYCRFSRSEMTAKLFNTFFDSFVPEIQQYVEDFSYSLSHVVKLSVMDTSLLVVDVTHT